MAQKPTLQFDLKKLPPGFGRALLVSQGMALLWWALAAWLHPQNIIPIWFDQTSTFMVVAQNVSAPYAASARFLNPPWTALLLWPFGLLPLEVSTLLQTCLYFAILTGVVFKFGGGRGALLITLVSFVAMDAVLELNIDWLPSIGLLVPPALSGVFLAIKPQLLLGYWLSLKRDDLLRALTVTAGVAALSLLLWGWWLPLAIANNAGVSEGRMSFNIAPPVLLTPYLAYPLGLLLAYVAWRRKDAVIGILAWLFFVPYVTLYSLLPVWAVCSARWPRFMLLVNVVMWVVYGGTIALGLLRRI
ncbi:MAG: hypothetical protein HXY40_10110 [Chloroflexi bacterium]|nr:hypothetical protein [Chloroflexota bacterium]